MVSARFAIRPGNTSPLGATPSENGTNFAIFSERATKVELCLFDQSGHSEIARIPLYRDEQDIWHIFIRGVGQDQLYGYRVYGKYNPKKGCYFNPNKLLLDPYAKSLFGEFSWGNAHSADEAFWQLDSAMDMPKCKVSTLPYYTGTKPNIPWHKTVIYECHAKGATKQYTSIPEELRGTYLGLAHPNFIWHLKSLGITAIELLPVHSFISEAFLPERGLSNYWGYNTLNFFTPHLAYAHTKQEREFQQMVSVLHDAGIEVIIDVVFNHTAEGNEQGPTLSLRGIDNQTYYRLQHNNFAYYVNDTGCGNTLNISHPKSLQLVMDSLRYWVQVYGVDGFRFDLASILGRDQDGFKKHHTFFQTLAQDPVLKGVKLIAEPWDLAIDGYQLGNYVAPWREWNDQYRDTVRSFWRGDTSMLPEFARFFHGSSHLFEKKGRSVTSSINFITAHDGFTLADLVSYTNKHNLANQEENRDGHDHNLSTNWGVEGQTENSEINALRLRAQKNLLLTLCLSNGVPMLCGGSEVAHSQGGNNNAYCQDNEISWIDWHANGLGEPQQHPLYQFISRALKLRSEFSLYRQSHFIHDDDPRFSVTWLNEHGALMQDSDWHNPDGHCLGYLMEDIQDDKALLLLFNASSNNVMFKLPEQEAHHCWRIRLSSYSNERDNECVSPGQMLTLSSYSAWVLSSHIKMPASKQHATDTSQTFNLTKQGV
ncbi:glycogen debranching protein GlgX [Pseudoalteromonas spongiae]|uniref:glycogen debranching protein GlgX n=1 Tax=Pseudoalteromonas spongiae TaxID=298657 RepID=UPI00026CBAF5|nr:glycogen debranching protein GlgX [Pseudoalteromonas spongiae]ATD00406.1 glycogen operon protein [Pseudoalteromonas spongiae UST010723-006]